MPSHPDRVRRAASETFVEVCQRLYAEKFTGAALVHFGQGVPHEVQPLVPTLKIRVDRPPRVSIP